MIYVINMRAKMYASILLFVENKIKTSDHARNSGTTF